MFSGAGEPNLPKILLKKHNNILLHDPLNKSIFKDPPMVSYRRCKNLQGYLTRASLTHRSVANFGGFSNCSDSKCGLPKCDLHRYNISGNTFMSTVTHQTFPISQTLDCESHNIIYLVTCTKPDCLHQYVGETGRKHKDRAPEHLRDINSKKDTPVSRHFREIGHNPSHFSIQVIEKCQKEETAYRQIRENYWELTLKSQINKQKSRIHEYFK